MTEHIILRRVLCILDRKFLECRYFAMFCKKTGALSVDQEHECAVRFEAKSQLFLNDKITRKMLFKIKELICSTVPEMFK